MKSFKSLIAITGLIILLGSSSAFGIPFDGSSVSISSAQFTFNSATDYFSTAVNGSSSGAWASTTGPNTVYVSFFDSSGVKVSSFTGATLEVTAVDFGLGLNSGEDGGFLIKNSSGNLLLSGIFGDGSSLTSSSTGADFMSSMIVEFSNTVLTGVDFYAPGLFSATLGNVGILSLDKSFTTKGSATATIESSVAPVPEPGTLLLLGVGFLGLGVWSCLNLKLKIRKGGLL